MIDRVLTSYVGISSDKDVEKHVRNLKTIYADKAKVKKACIWINGVKVKFGSELNHTVRNINKSYAKAGVKASVKNSKLVLSTRSNTLKIHDPKQILKSLVDKDRVGINKYHDIQIIRKGIGDAKFIYTFNNKSKDYRLDRDFSKSSTIYCAGGSSVHLQNLVDNLANVGVVQNLVHGQAPEPIFDVVVQNVEPIDFNVGALVPLQQNLSLENSREDSVLIPAAKFEIAKIVENLSMNGQEPEIKNVNPPEINHEIEPQIDENIDYLARAIELLNNKNKRETRLILTEVVKKGDVNLIESMVQVIPIAIISEVY